MRYSTPVFFAAVMVIAVTAPVSRGQIIDEDLKLLASDGEAWDYFGWSIAVDNNLVAIGANKDDVYGQDSGSGYVFNATTGEQITKLIPNAGNEDQKFGLSIAIDDGIVVVGAPEDRNNGTWTGAAFLFDASTGELITKLLASDGDWGNEFGWAVAIDDGIVAVSAMILGLGGGDGGAVYLFDAATGEELAKLRPLDKDGSAEFGFSLALSDGLLAVGATNDRGNGSFSGSAYVFDIATGEQIAKLVPNDGERADEFGYAVDIDNGYVVVGSRGDDDNGSFSGSAYLFDAATGQQIVKFLPNDGAEYDVFGKSVGIDNGIVAVGATQASWRGYIGKAYLFDAATGEQIVRMAPSDGQPDARFGSAIAIQNDVVAVGAQADFNNGAPTGSAYIFDANSTDTCLNLKVENLVAGEVAQFTIRDGPRGAKAITVVGIRRGETIVNNYAQYCATFGIKGVKAINIIGGTKRRFDEDGNMTFRLKIPRIASGLKVLFQTAQRGTCPDECMSNLVEAKIQ